MKIKLLTLLFLTTLSSTISFGQQPKIDKEIFALLETYALALCEKNIEKAAAFMTSDPSFQYISRGFLTTKEEWSEYQSESWARMDRYSLKWTKKNLKVLSKKSAVAICHSSVSFSIKGGPFNLVMKIYTITFQNEKDGWKITSIHESEDSIENALHK